VMRRYWIAAGGAALVSAVVAIAAAWASAIDGDDPVMEALCAIPPIMNEQAFLENRVAFNWTGTTGTPIERLPVEVPGYAPGPDATMEEMNLDKATVATLANVAAGRGVAWAGPDHNSMITELFPEDEGAAGNIIRYSVGERANRLCATQPLVTNNVQRAVNYFRGNVEDARGMENLVAVEMRDELELSATETLARLRENEARGQCLRTEWAPREALPLRAYRAYEYRRRGPFSYALSPHIVTRGSEVVYFSMGVVRQSLAYERLHLTGPDPGERVCCVTPLPVGGCSRYGGPDPYMFHIRALRARWRHGQPFPKE
jgi:hypothetical protein